jgi:hypothetical protein
MQEKSSSSIRGRGELSSKKYLLSQCNGAEEVPCVRLSSREEEK